MNKKVSLAIEKAVSNLDKIENNDLKDLNSKKPDLFSLNNQTELLSFIIIILGLALTISTVDTLVNAISSLFVIDGEATFKLDKKTTNSAAISVPKKTTAILSS